ncbi:site-2 protease family protein [Candidatus Saccharibacteria bacterium]|nr:site-2 protease family protein [Candidatus Saccharibacteria bacterium]
MCKRWRSVKENDKIVSMDIDIVYLVIVIAVVFFSMVLHELMHGLTAYWLGDTTAQEQGRLTLNPIKHIDPFLTLLLPVMMVIAGGFVHGMPVFGGAKPVPFRPDRVKGGEWGAALIGIVGPLTNLVLAFICFMIAWFSGVLAVQGGELYYAGGIMAQILTAGIMVNLGFFAFNILPIPPLDGSRLLYAVAPSGVQRAMAVIENAGLLVVFAVVLILSQPLSYVLGAIINAILKFFVMIFGA